MMMFRSRHKTSLPDPISALPGRESPLPVENGHFVLGREIQPPFPDHLEQIVFGLGCFWGAEEIFWRMDGVYTTAVGYTGGSTPNPNYEEVCSGRTGQNEAVLVVYDPDVVSVEQLLKTFWEVHDPTQGMRQGNDVGTQYRSGIYTSSDTQAQAAAASRDVYAQALADARRGEITTEIAPAGPFYYAEAYHQQYLAKNPNGYRCHAATGVAFPVATA